jgi:hypothetical protein
MRIDVSTRMNPRSRRYKTEDYKTITDQLIASHKTLVRRGEVLYADAGEAEVQITGESQRGLPKT